MSAGGVIYSARCISCGAIWTRYAWGLGTRELLEEIHWGKEGSADPPRLPVGATVNPYLQVVEGQVVSGTVVTVAEFGLFVKLAPRLDGVLVFERCNNPDVARALRQGQTIRVLIKEVDVECERIALDLCPDAIQGPNVE